MDPFLPLVSKAQNIQKPSSPNKRTRHALTLFQQHLTKPPLKISLQPPPPTKKKKRRNPASTRRSHHGRREDPLHHALHLCLSILQCWMPNPIIFLMIRKPGAFGVTAMRSSHCMKPCWASVLIVRGEADQRVCLYELVRPAQRPCLLWSACVGSLVSQAECLRACLSALRALPATDTPTKVWVHLNSIRTTTGSINKTKKNQVW